MEKLECWFPLKIGVSVDGNLESGSWSRILGGAGHHHVKTLQLAGLLLATGPPKRRKHVSYRRCRSGGGSRDSR